MSSVNRADLTLPFQRRCFFSVSCLIAQARTSAVWDGGTLVLFIILGKALFITVKWEVSCGFFMDTSVLLRTFLFLVLLSRKHVMSVECDCLVVVLSGFFTAGLSFPFVSIISELFPGFAPWFMISHQQV